MENNQPKKKNAGLTALIALLLIVTTVASCIGIYAWARYISSRDGNATAPVAKWNFNVNLKRGDNRVALSSEAIDLATTQTEASTHVANGKIAPGTSGQFQIEIDSSNTEVDFEYEVTIALANCPRNITFKRVDTAGTETTLSAGGAENTLTRSGLTFKKYVTNSENQTNGVRLETIKWDWPYSDENDAEYDTRDNADQNAINASQEGKVIMNITVTGTEMLYNPNASVAETPGTVAYQATHASTSGMARWQSVNYTPGEASISNDTLSLAGASLIGNTKVADINGAYLDGTISTKDAGDWVILDFDQTTGEVKIIPKEYSETTLQLSGMEGYNNAIAALDKVASIYKNDAYATSSRSLTVDDVNKVTGHTPDGEDVYYSWENDYGMDASTLDIVQNGGDIIEVASESGMVEHKKYTSTLETGCYNYNATLAGYWSCWLASRCVELDSYNCNFCVRHMVNGSNVNFSNLFHVSYYVDSNDSSNSDNRVVPVVTLKSDIHMTKDNNTWILSQN